MIDSVLEWLEGDSEPWNSPKYGRLGNGRGLSEKAAKEIYETHWFISSLGESDRLEADKQLPYMVAEALAEAEFLRRQRLQGIAADYGFGNAQPSTNKRYVVEEDVVAALEDGSRLVAHPHYLPVRSRVVGISDEENTTTWRLPSGKTAITRGCFHTMGFVIPDTSLEEGETKRLPIPGFNELR